MIVKCECMCCHACLDCHTDITLTTLTCTSTITKLYIHLYAQLGELEHEAAQALHYKDEADSLRHKAERAEQLEKTTVTLKDNVCSEGKGVGWASGADRRCFEFLL